MGCSDIQLQKPGSAIAAHSLSVESQLCRSEPTPQSTKDMTKAQLRDSGILKKAQLYADMLQRSSATARQQPIRSILMPAKTKHRVGLLPNMNEL